MTGVGTTPGGTTPGDTTPGSGTQQQGGLPGILSRSELRAELARLKRASPHSYQDLTQLTERSRTTLHDWITGKHLPVARDNDDFRSLVQVLGSPDPDHLLNSIIQLRNPSSRRVASATSNPYRGLSSFTELDAAFFFGRSSMTAQLIQRADNGVVHKSNKPLIVIGASGSGKTSLLRAGLLSNLAQRPGYVVRYTTPSAGGFDPPPDTVPSSTSNATTNVVVIDQFEEHFSPDHSPDSAQTLAAMTAFCKEPNSLLVIGVRSDFFHRVAEIPLLLAGLQDSPIVVGAMSTEEVTAAITRPADRASIQLAPALLVELVNQFANSPGTGAVSNSLPLLSHVLHELVETSDQNSLSLDDYLKMGGLEQAIEQSAEKALAQSGISEEACRQLFVQLVEVTQDAQPTRRIARIADPSADIETVIDAFAAHRLITTDYDTVSISHEVLLSAWPRLAAWVDDGRAGLVAINRLRSAAKFWDQIGQDGDALLRGGQLSAAEEVASDPHAGARLTELDHQFLVACRLAVADQAAEARCQLSRQTASQANLLYDKSPNLSAQLALVAHDTAATTESRSALIRTTSPLPGSRFLCGPGPIVLAASTGLAAAVVFSSPDSPSIHVSELLATHDHHSWILPKPGDQPVTTALALSADGRLMAHGSVDGTIHLLDATHLPDDSALGETGEVYSAGLTLEGPIKTLLFSPAADRVFAAGGDGKVICWGLSTEGVPGPRGLVPTPGTTLSLSMDDNATLLASSNREGTIALWPLAAPCEATNASDPVWQSNSTHHGPAPTVALAPDASVLAAGYHNGQVRVWSISVDSADARAEEVGVAVVEVAEVTEISLEGGQFGSWVNSVRFSPSGRLMAAASSDGNVRLWDTNNWTQVLNDFQHPTVVTSAQFLNEETLISAAEDGTLRTWDISNALQPHASESVWSVDYDASGSVRVSASRSIARVVSVTGDSGSVEAGSAETEEHFTPADGTEFSGTSAVSPDGLLVALGTRSGPIRIESLAVPDSGGSRRPLPATLEGLRSLVENLAFSPNGSLLCGVDRDGTVQLWTVDGQRSASTAGLVGLFEGGGFADVEPPAVNLAFSSDSRLLAVTSESGNTSIFDTSTFDESSPGESSPETPRTLVTFRSGDSFALGVAFRPSYPGQSPVLAIGNADQSTRLWDLSEPCSPQLLAHLPGATGNTMAVAFNADGTLLSVGTTNGTVSIWDTSVIAEPVLSAQFRSPERGVYALAFSPSWPILTGCGPNQSLFHWTIDESLAASLIKNAVGDPLTKAERLQHLPGHHDQGP